MTISVPSLVDLLQHSVTLLQRLQANEDNMTKGKEDAEHGRALPFFFLHLTSEDLNGF